MLHIDKNTDRYLFELERNFLAVSDDIAASQDYVGHLKREINKTFDDIELDWNKHYNRVEKGFNAFQNKLLNALSDPLPSYLVGKPRPRLRKFPYKNTGDMVNSFYGSIHKIAGDNSMVINISAGFASAHAKYTNEGWNSSKRDVHWLNWADKIFGTTLEFDSARHSSKVPNIRDVLLGYYS